VLKLHVAAALTALLLGTIQLIGVKGTAAHRVVGWSWVDRHGDGGDQLLLHPVLNPGSP
jgi:uncharacterized membrane protein